MDEDLLCLKKAAQLLDVTEVTIRTWDKQGKIKCVRSEGGHRRVPLCEIERINAFRKPYMEFIKQE